MLLHLFFCLFPTKPGLFPSTLNSGASLKSSKVPQVCNVDNICPRQKRADAVYKSILSSIQSYAEPFQN